MKNQNRMSSRKLRFKTVPDDIEKSHLEYTVFRRNEVAVPVEYNGKEFYLQYEGGYNTDSYLFETHDSFWILSQDIEDFVCLEQFLKVSLDHTKVNVNTGEMALQGSLTKEILGNIKNPLKQAKELSSYVENFS